MVLPNIMPGEFLERLPVGICVVDREGTITRFNCRAAEIWGREPGRGEKFSGAAGVFDVENRGVRGEEAPIARVLRSRKAVRNFELAIQRPDGKRVFVLSTVAPVFGAGGAFAGAVDAFFDVSDRKLSEDARRVAERLHASARVASSFTDQMRAPVESVNRLLDALGKESGLSPELRRHVTKVRQQFCRFQELAQEMGHLRTAA